MTPEGCGASFTVRVRFHPVPYSTVRLYMCAVSSSHPRDLLKTPVGREQAGRGFPTTRPVMEGQFISLVQSSRRYWKVFTRQDVGANSNRTTLDPNSLRETRGSAVSARAVYDTHSRGGFPAGAVPTVALKGRRGGIFIQGVVIVHNVLFQLRVHTLQFRDSYFLTG